MEVTDTGVAIDDVVDAVKNVIKAADISAINTDRDLRVTSLQFVLNAVATTTVGGGMDFRLPFLGMKFSLGSTVTRHDTHTIDITLVPPDLKHEIREGTVETVLFDAIETIRALMVTAIGGDDPFVLKAGIVELRFAVTKNGSITLGFNGEFKDEITHMLKIGVELPSAALS
jgi:Trypsin-co-occurring domain 2